MGVNWRLKALVQQLLSHVPLGERLNYLLQRHVTRSLPLPDAACLTMVGWAQDHVAAVERHRARPVGDAVFYEFGAGWDLLIPLAYYGVGVNRQILIDIRPLLRPALLNDAIARLRRLTAREQLTLTRPPSQPVPRSRPAAVAALRELYGIDYRAPADARASQLPLGAVDCITSTNTLEHIPPGEIAEILAECRRILRDDGIVSFRIDYQDHFSYFDARISAYNFLRYSPRAWTRYNPSLHYQNRLRHSDYVRLVEDAGFDIVEAHCTEGSADDFATLANLTLDRGFRHYAPRDLAIRNSLLVLRKRASV